MCESLHTTLTWQSSHADQNKWRGETHLHGVSILAGGDALLVEAQPLLHLLPQLLPKCIRARELREAVDPARRAAVTHSRAARSRRGAAVRERIY